MGLKVGTSDVGVYLGSEQIAGVSGVTLQEVMHTKRGNTYTYLYFDCRNVSTLHMRAGTLPSGVTIHMCGGDNNTFDDAGTNALTGTDIATYASGEEKDTDVTGYEYVAIEYIGSGSTARYAASGSAIISGAQAVKCQ